MKSLFLAILTYASFLQANPFAIDFPDKEEVTAQDYVQIQRKLKEIDVAPLLHSLYPEGQNFTTMGDFFYRITRGLRQAYADPEKGLFPSIHLEKINGGSDNCLVSSATFNNRYVALVKKIPEALRKVGFKGYFYYRIGGYPNPTGIETKFLGVPYSFKIFLLKEAEKLGFKKVIWIDSALLPLRDPTPLFQWLDKNPVFMRTWWATWDAWRFILPETRALLQSLTGTDVLNAHTVSGTVFGFKMDSWEAQKIIADFYQMVELGTPFLSCFPEENVLTAIIGQDSLKTLKRPSFDLLRNADHEGKPETPELIEEMRTTGAFFFHLQH